LELVTWITISAIVTTNCINAVSVFPTIKNYVLTLVNVYEKINTKKLKKEKERHTSTCFILLFKPRIARAGKTTVCTSAI
jgi:hypothetical protein